MSISTRRGLASLTGSPVVELNRAAAVGEVEGPGGGPESGRRYRRALALTTDDAERRFLERRLAQLPQ